MISRRGMLALAAACLLPRRTLAAGLAPLEAMPFSSLAPGGPLPPWLERFTFGARVAPTRFDLVEDGGRTVLRARADAAASGLARALRVDLRERPLLAWRWKVTRLVEKGNLARREGDDYAARLYVTFDLDPATLGAAERIKLALARAVWGERLPLAALCYVWDAHAPAGTFAPNAYTDRVWMVVADSGAAALGRWVGHLRDVAGDYRRAFGAEPPAVNAVIVSADTDNTRERAESYFADVEFRPRPPS